IKTSKNELPPTPTPRDLQIYKGHVILHHDQLSIAANFNISRARISQVVNKVKRWLAAGGSPTDPEIRDHLAQERLSKASQRIRLLRIIDKATYAAEVRLPSQKIIRSRYHGDSEVWRDETSILSPEVNLPALRVLLRAVKDLGEFEKHHSDDACPDVRRGSPDPAASEDQLLLSVYELLCRWRSRAEAAGHFQPSAHIPELIADTLRSLLGPLASPLSVEGTLRMPSPSANATPDVSPLEPARIALTTGESTTSTAALTSPHEKTSPKC
ncbi:MAG TPA: hypothetical protein VGI40_09325, partial [Pirellulaceae bacterium]